MRIRFLGLICHIDRAETGNDDVAVLMKAPTNPHFPRLRVPNRHIFGQPPGMGGTTCVEIAGLSLNFSLGAGVANRAGLNGRIPKLTDFGGAGGALHPNIATKNAADTTDEIESFVTLPQGTYGVEDSFSMLGRLPEGDVCIARTVTYDAVVPAGTTKITITGIPSPIELKPTAIITITNLELRPSVPPVNHFSQYGQVFQPAKAITSILGAGVSCPGGTIDFVYPICTNEGSLTVGVECTNSQYP